MRPHENPFRVSRLESLAFRPRAGADGAETVRAALALLRSHGGRGAIVGPHGTGKSTLMGEIGRSLAAQDLDVRTVQLRDDAWRLDDKQWHAVQSADRTVALLIDGADLMPWPHWIRLRWHSRQAAALVVTSHDRPLLPPIHQTRSDVALLAELVTELLDGSDLSVPAHDDLERLLAHHHGDIRATLRALYDQYAELEPTVLAPH